jgi:outer membrane protein OmpA-like peptidoglycan-associated protein
MNKRWFATILLLVALPAMSADRPEVIALNQRLATLQADPDLIEFAAYERLQAQQAVAVLAKARGKQRDAALYLADRRVEIAETAARAESARREADRLERTRSELLVEASRRDAARARQEAERLRIQAQIQAEEAERLRLAAEAETLARQDAEDTLTTVAGQQSARLSAARQKEARLAREEAELVSGAKLPASKFEERGEIFTLGSNAFNAGSPKLSDTGASQVSALAAYLQANPKAKARIEGFGDAQTPGQRRADALRDALVAAGVPKARLQTAAKGNGSRSRAVDVIVAQP